VKYKTNKCRRYAPDTMDYVTTLHMPLHGTNRYEHLHFFLNATKILYGSQHFLTTRSLKAALT